MAMPEALGSSDPTIRTEQALTKITEALTGLEERKRQTAQDIESAVFMLVLPHRDELAAPTISYSHIYDTQNLIIGSDVTVYHPRTNKIVRTINRGFNESKKEELGIDGWIEYGKSITEAMGREIDRVKGRNSKKT